MGAIVCKLDMHKKVFRRGYIAMLAVDSKYRRKGIGESLSRGPHVAATRSSPSQCLCSFSPSRALLLLPPSLPGTNLVKKAIYAMVDGDCDEVVGRPWVCGWPRGVVNAA